MRPTHEANDGGRGRCRHANCGCTEAPGADDSTCSSYCSGALHSDIEEPPGACACGHDACVASHAENVAPHGGREVKISIGTGN